MNPVVEEWIEIAKADLGMAQRELEGSDHPYYGGVCFHAQQCAEKIMKALLISRGIRLPKIHDLIFLSNLISEGDSTWSWPEEELQFLTRAAVDYRYPGETPDYDEASQAVDISARILFTVKQRIL